MSELQNRYQLILNDLEQHIQNKEELEYVKDKMNQMSMLFLEVIDRLTVLTDHRMKNIEQTQQELEKRMANVQNVVDDIQSDIYEDDDNYEFEILCPYCNHQFVANVDTEFNTEIECPECHNTIELDWNEEEAECGHECSHCHGSCVHEDEEDYNEDDENQNEEDM